MNLSGTERGRPLITVIIVTLLTIVMGAVLVAGFRLATRMTSNITALQHASVLQTYPATISQHLTSLRDRLEARTYAGQSLANLRTTTEDFERDLQQIGAEQPGSSAELDQARLLWQQYQPVLRPVVAFTDQPYVDTDDAGSALSESGQTHYAEVRRAQLFARENAEHLQELLAAVASQLQRNASAEASRLRMLLSAGVIAALVLAIAAAYFQLTRIRHERAAREAQEQTRDILLTVKEGFFLLDSNYRIGAVWSQALTRMFARQDFAGLAFEDLLRNLVPESTLSTATKYIKLLWGDRAHENLMRSINPLSQLEIHVNNGRGGQDTRYLQFDFHRVMGKQSVKHVLVSVTDVTSNVLLARELQESQENANSQVDMMLGVLHVDPLQLSAFLDTTETSLQLVNAILKEPARTDADFRNKLDGLFREMHSIKGEASAVNLASVGGRVHALEDMVSELKARAELSGNDFLPLVVKLDELMAHLRSLRELANRLSIIREPVARNELRPAAGNSNASDLSQTLHGLAERLANDHGKSFKLALSGLAEIPQVYHNTLKDVLIQMLRNAAVHGIEPSAVRRAQTKDDIGVVRIEFRKSNSGFELVFEDDGAGLSPEQLKSVALRKQIITPEEAAGMDARTAMALIFRPGFSTQDHVSMDAGRGVGMDVVARSIYAVGGKIGINTKPGQYTRFKVALPIPTASTAVA